MNGAIVSQIMNRLKLLLVDDNPDFLTVAANFLSQHSSIQVVGLTESGESALGMVRDQSPDLVLMDFSMPGMSGLEATRRLKLLIPPPQVIILTMHEGAEFSTSAHRAGADAFITKSEFGDALLPAIGRLFPELQIEPTNECA
jgi:DNA-binding NarL/FixJ family response regulator